MWGATGVWIAHLSDMPLGIILLFRFLLSLFIVSFILLAMARPIATTTSEMAGGVALFFYYVLTTGAFLFANMVSVSLIVSTTPAVVMVAECVKGNQPTRREMFGGVMAFCGVVVLVAGSKVAGFERDDGEWLGQLCALGAVLAMTAFSLTGRAVDSHAISTSFWSYLLGTVALLIWLIGASITEVAWVMPSGTQWFWLLGLAVFSTVIAAVCYKNACRLCGATTAAVIRLSTPLFAALFLVTLFGQDVSLRHLIAGVLVLLGAYLVITRNRSSHNATR